MKAPFACTSFKSISITLALSLSVLITNAQTKFKFLGATIKEDKGCINKVNTKTEEILLPYDESYPVKRAAFEAELKAAHSSYDIATFDVEPGNKYVIALVAKTRRCTGNKAASPEVISYNYFSAENEEGINRKMESDKKLYSEILGIEVVRYVPWEQDVAKMQGRSGKKETSSFAKNVDGLLIKGTTFSKKESAKISFLNKNSSKTAIVVVLDAKTGKPLNTPTMLRFDERISLAIRETDEIEIDVKFIANSLPPKEKQGLLDQVKNYVKKQVVPNKDGVFDYSERLDLARVVFGIRG
jgi:hypothetical protein